MYGMRQFAPELPVAATITAVASNDAPATPCADTRILLCIGMLGEDAFK